MCCQNLFIIWNQEMEGYQYTQFSITWDRKQHLIPCTQTPSVSPHKRKPPSWFLNHVMKQGLFVEHYHMMVSGIVFTMNRFFCLEIVVKAIFIIRFVIELKMIYISFYIYTYRINKGTLTNPPIWIANMHLQLM